MTFLQPSLIAVTVSQVIVGVDMMLEAVVKRVSVTLSKSTQHCVVRYLFPVTDTGCGTCSNRCYREETTYCCDSQCSAGCFSGESNNCYVSQGMC